MKDAIDIESKKVTKRSNDWDSLNGKKNRVGNQRSTDDVSPVIKRHSTFKEELVTHKFEEPYIIPFVTRPKFKERDIFKDDFKSAERTKDVLGLERKGTTIEAKLKALFGSRSKKSIATKTTIPKGKSKKDEEKRKKIEELLTQRIAERSALTSKTTKIDKSNAQLVSRDMKKSNKIVIKSSTIDRLSAARVVNPKLLPTTKSKAGDKKWKVKPTKVKPLDNNIGITVSSGPKRNTVDTNTGKQLPKASSVWKLGIGDRVAQIGVSTRPQL
nr:hypothetical protein [Tanacetum cinerariifolium]